jgi:hypothetical protein
MVFTVGVPDGRGPASMPAATSFPHHLRSMNARELGSCAPGGVLCYSIHSWDQGDFVAIGEHARLAEYGVVLFAGSLTVENAVPPCPRRWTGVRSQGVISLTCPRLWRPVVLPLLRETGNRVRLV